MAKTLHQEAMRAWKTFRDPFRRLWGAYVENSTSEPVGRIEYIEHLQPGTEFPFAPPWQPDQKYLRTNRNSDRLEILFADMRSDSRAARREYETDAIKIGRQIHKDAFDAANPFTRDVLAVIGPGPGNLIEPVLALEARNPWMLGQTDTPDARLAPLFDKRAMEVPDEYEDRYGDFGTLVTDRAPEAAGEGEFPQLYAPGRWRLSDGTTMQATREAAERAQAALLVSV